MSKQINEFKVRNKNRKGNKTRRKLTREIKRINTKRKTTKKNNRKQTIKNKYRKTNRKKRTSKKQYQVGGELNPFTKSKYIKKIEKLAPLFGEPFQIPRKDEDIVNMLDRYNNQYSELLTQKIQSGQGDLSDILNYILVNYSIENNRISKKKNQKTGLLKDALGIEERITNKVNQVIAENKFVLQSFLLNHLPTILEYISGYINKSIEKTKLKPNVAKITTGISESISDTYSQEEFDYLKERFHGDLHLEIDSLKPVPSEVPSEVPPEVSSKVPPEASSEVPPEEFKKVD